LRCNSLTPPKRLNLAHAAHAELGDDAIVGDALANHVRVRLMRGRILGFVGVRINGHVDCA